MYLADATLWRSKIVLYLPVTMNERRLILGLKKGDHDSYETLFELYYAKFVNFADTVLRDRTVAKDIVQEAFIRLWLNRSRLDENQSLENYLYVIVKRLLLNHIRDTKPALSLESESAQAVQTNSWGGQDLIVIANETRNRINDAIDRMPPQRRAVFTMSRNQGLSNKEIAESLQISVKTVERHMTLALAELRENIS